MKKSLIIIWCALIAITSFAHTSHMTPTPAEPEVLFKTTAGDILVKLYNDTPAHRDNMLKLVKEGFYDGVLFHRVIKDFMVQTGDPNSKDSTINIPLGAGDPGYTIEAEILYPKHFHKAGALAAARTADQVNPERRSSGSQFYIVTGRTYSPEQLKGLERQITMQRKQEFFMGLQNANREKIRALYEANDTAALENLRNELVQITEASVPDAEMPDEVIQAYSNVGGSPHLDGTYTVFGEVVKGMDIVDKIQCSPVDSQDRPTEDIRIISAAIVKE